MVFSRLRQRWLSSIFIYGHLKNISIFTFTLSVSRHNILCPLFYPDLFAPVYLLFPFHADSSLSFRPPLCILAQVYKTHWQQNMFRLSLLPHLCLSLSLKYWKCLPHYSALAFSSSSHLIPHSLSSSLWRSKWRQRSFLLSCSSPAKLAACSIHR